MKRAKEAVNRLGDAKRKRIALDLLNDVDYKIPSLGEAAQDTFDRIDKIFSSSAIVETSADVKLRATQRAPVSATSGKVRGNPPGAWRKNTA